MSNVEIQRKFGPKTMKDVHELVYSGERKKFELVVINFKWKIRAVDEFKVNRLVFMFDCLEGVVFTICVCFGGMR